MSPEDVLPALPAPDLSHGRRVFVVLHKDALRERIDVRASQVLRLEEDVLFLAQTEPPVPEELSGREVEVAVLAPEGEGGLRPVGYAARLLNARADYPGGPGGFGGPGGEGGELPALAVSAPTPGGFFETSLRMHYRVPVDPSMNVVMRLEGFETPQVLDFSAGGARVRLARGEDAYAGLAVGAVLPFRLLFLGSGFAAGDGVVRSLTPSPEGDFTDAGLFFTNMEIADIRYLERMVARTVAASRQRERDADYF